MKFVLLFFAVFCCTVYSIYGQTADDKTCLQEKVAKPCQSICDAKKINKPRDLEHNTEFCCKLSRCYKCWMDASSKCSKFAQDEVRTIVDQRRAHLLADGCKESQMYPSIKCLHYFYTAWFYVVPLLIFAVIGAVVAFVVIRRRRRF